MDPAAPNAFGLTVSFEGRFPSYGSWPGGSPSRRATGDLVIRLADRSELVREWSGGGRRVWATALDGMDCSLELGSGGDHLFRYGDRALFLLTPDGSRLSCAPLEPGDQGWQRALLDSVLVCVSLIRGYSALHASVVELQGRVVALAGPSGSGKTSLAVALIQRGARLICDDVAVVSERDGEVVVLPSPPLMNVPAGTADVDRIGSPLGRSAAGDEVWLSVDSPADRPCPLSDVLLLSLRGGGEQSLVRPVAQSPVPLMPHMVGLSHLPEATHAAFLAACAIARHASMRTLDVNRRDGPEAVAELVGAELS